MRSLGTDEQEIVIQKLNGFTEITCIKNIHIYEKSQTYTLYSGCVHYPLHYTTIVFQKLFWKIFYYFFVSTVKYNENDKQGKIISFFFKLWIKYMRMLATTWLKIMKIRNTVQSNNKLNSSGITLQWPCVLTLEAQRLAHKLQTTEQCHFSSNICDSYKPCKHIHNNTL